VLINEYKNPDFEIVIGIVSPIGSDLDALADRLEEELRVFGYESSTIRLSDVLKSSTGRKSFKYYWSLMDAGDALRTRAGVGEAVAAAALGLIRNERGDKPIERRHAWILRSLKHPDEIDFLKKVYGGRFVSLGVHQNEVVRRESGREMLSKDAPSNIAAEGDVDALMERDEMDLASKFGQKVRDAYSKVDYFIDLETEIGDEASRFVNLIFGEPFHTPTRDEVCMFAAYGVSLRSSDPGRQVGAVIASAEGEILSTGTNEVPKYPGGEYWEGDVPDARDFKQQFDFNKRQGRLVLGELLNALADEGLLSAELAALERDSMADEVIDNHWDGLKHTRATSLIEFGRVVHAEMAAITQASRTSATIKGATLYTTAYPCHMCMRLIVSAGIVRIVYVDPYPKSLAAQMYGDSTTSDRTSKDLVVIDPFSGASWGLYPKVFRGRKRGRDATGRFEKFDKTTARFRTAGPDPISRAKRVELHAFVALSEALDKNKDTNKGE
jgi:deoxycytidylate deaminase